MTTKNTDTPKIRELSEDIKGIIEKILDGKLSLQDNDDFYKPRPPMLITSALKHKLDTQYHQPNLKHLYIKARQLAINLGCEDIPPYQEKPLIGLQKLQQCLTNMSEETVKKRHTRPRIALNELTKNEHEDIFMLKPNFYGMGLDINALIRKAGIKIKNLLKALIYRKSLPK